jgi:ubiquinone/menaquinone biosynthesis C-methylase UbiE
MNSDGQHLTHQVYEDPEIVEGYIKRNATNPKQKDLIVSFSKTISGKKVLDLGCGPGHESYIFSELGFDVTGLDFSSEMIRRAKDLKDSKNKPTFVVGDMTKLTDYFDENQFDAIWASASLLHIRPRDIQATLQGMTSIAKDGAKIFIGLKGGEGTLMADEDKYGKKMQREFTLWSKGQFLEEVERFGWKLESFDSKEGSEFRGQPTQWLQFFFTMVK